MQKSQSLEESIHNYLTLRYDPSTPSLKHKNWQDFIPLHNDPEGVSTERHLRKAILCLEKYDNIVIPLSSGVDSPLLLMLIRETFPDKEIFCINHIGVHDESKEAQNFADQFNAVFIKIKFNEIIKSIPKMVRITGEPRWNAYQFEIFECVREMLDPEEKTIVVTGDGADELYGGYTFRYKQFMENINDNLMIYNYLNCHKNDFVEDQYDMFNNPPRPFQFYDTLEPYFDNNLHPLNRVMLADYNGKLLHDFITTGNSVSKYYDIPIYAPYMELSNFATHVPQEEKITIDRGLVIGKKPLRNIAHRWGVKLTEKKIPYSMDIISDYKDNEELVESFLLKKDLKIYNYINYKWVDENLSVDYDYRYINKWLQLVALEEWLNLVR